MDKKSVQIQAWIQQVGEVFSLRSELVAGMEMDAGIVHGYNLSFQQNYRQAECDLVIHMSGFSRSSELDSISAAFLLPLKRVFRTAPFPPSSTEKQSFHAERLLPTKVEHKAEVGLPFS